MWLLRMYVLWHHAQLQLYLSQQEALPQLQTPRHTGTLNVTMASHPIMLRYLGSRRRGNHKCTFRYDIMMLIRMYVH